MPSHNHSTRATHGKRTSLTVSSALWSMLLLLLCASMLLAQPTGPVTGLTATPNSTSPSSQIDLAWTSPGGTPPITYDIHRDITSGFTPSGGNLITTVTDPTVTYSNTGLSEATTYYYVVIAQAGAFASSEVSATTAPSAPTALSATTLGNTSVSVSWTDNSNGETGFTVEYSTDANFVAPAGTPVAFGANATAAPSAVTQTITGLTASTTYYFRVQANGTTNSTWFPTPLPSGISATTTPAAAPTSLVATAISSTQINLAWVDNSGIETSYEVERKTGVSGTYVIIASLGANTTAYSDGSLVASTAYYYRVRAVVNTVTPISYSNYSNEHSATTLPVIPNAPINLVANATSSSTILLSWNATGVTGEDGFKVYRSTSPSVAIIPANLVGSVGTDITTFTDTGLLSSTTYYYKVVAFNVSGNSAPTNEASATTFSPPPAAPSSLAAIAAGSTQINVTFVDNATTESGFKIYISTSPLFIAGPSNLLATIGSSAGTGLTVNYASMGLVPNTTYYYQVSAYNAGGESFAISPAEVSATTADVAPSAPTNLVANTVLTTSVLLNWTDNANNETGGFKVERKLSTAATYTEITSAVPPSSPVTATGGTIAYTDATLAPNTTYNYRVRAYNGGGNSAFSNVITVTTLPTPPAAPTSLAASTISNSQIDLSWMDNSTDESNFVIERSIDNFFTTQTTINASAVSGTGTRNFSNTGLAGGTLYYYRVKAINAGGSSAYTLIVSIATLPDPPAAPSGLMATAVSSDQINLAWNDVATETGYEVEMKQGLAGTYSMVATTGVNQITANITGLDGNTLYYFRVRAVNATGNSGYSNEANATTFPEGPNAAPTSLVATAVSNSQIDLAWFDNSTNEAGFKIERSASSASGPFTQIGTVGSNVQIFSSTGLLANTQYWYRVRSYNGGGDSPYSNVDNEFTFDNPPSPPPTSLIVTSVNGTTINLQWTDASTSEDSFRVERSMTAGGPFTTIGAVDGSIPPSTTAGLFPFSDAGLNGSTQYFYRVRAKNSGGSSSPSNEVSATTGPSTPNNLFATAISNSQVNLLWADNATNENGYDVERSISPIFSPLDGGFPVALPANTTSYSDMTGLTGSSVYYYRVRATSLTLGNSDYSNTATVTTPPNIPNPLTFTTTGNSTVNLTWNDVSIDEHGFGIQRKIGATGIWTGVDSLKRNPIPGDPGIFGTGPVTKSHTNLLSGTTYFFRVFAYNTNGSSGFTNEINLTTPQFAPNPPTTLVATGATSQITLNWVDASNNETGFKIERSLTPSTGFAQIATVGPDFTVYTNTGVTPSVVYYYRVRSYNSGGDSPYSNEASASANPDLPNVPTGLTATAISNTQINLTWTDQSTNEVGFKIERKNGPSGTYTEIATVGAGVQAYNSAGLTGLTQYFFRIRSYNNDGNSAYTDEKDATTLIDPPGVPSGLSATAISSSQINLSWQDNATNEDGFQIERKTGPSGTYAVIATIGPSAVLNVTHSDNTVAGSTQYFYRIRSFNVSWTSPASNEANATTPAPSIAAPSGLTATAVSSSSINLTWVDNASNETGYKVERSLTSGSGFSEIADLPAGSNSYASNGLNASTQYFFRVRAYNATPAFSSYSNEANATTQAAATLGTPSGLTATAVGSTQINLAWNDVTGETGYMIERKIGAGAFSQIGTTGANANTYQDASLNANTTYTYRVRATDGANNSPYSNEASTKTWLIGPTNLVATASGTTINLTWAESIVNENGFIVERKTGVAGSYAQVGSTLPQNSTSFSNTGLTASTQYFYRVYAINGIINRSEYSNEANATTNGGGLSAPANLTATGVSKTQINLAWNDVTGETGFLIERKTGSAGAYAQIGTVGANVVTFNNTGLAVNTLYFYRVRATNGSSNSAYSNEDDARTFMNGPTNLVASILNSTQINLTWAESITNETNFQVERGTALAGPFTLIATLAQNSTSHVDNVANTVTTYYYRVRGISATNVSEYSNVAASGSSGNVNLALNKPITASSVFSTSTPTRGNDGNNTSFWRSGTVSAGSPIAWLRVELAASPVTVARVVIVWNQTYHATQYEIQVSNDGTNWTIVHTNNSATNATQDISFTPVSARYVRAYLKMPNTGSYRLVELQAYATGSISKPSELAAAENAVIPESITLDQNYPNPFNPSTTIAFSLPAGVHVSLKVINVTGQEVANLIDGYRDRGNHRVTFKAAKLPTGVYYAVLKAGDVTQIKRMTLAK